MSRYFSRRFDALTPYVPGEQPGDGEYIKLNTNENPFPPSEKAKAFAEAHTRPMQLYSDPEGVDLREALAALLEVKPEELVLVNGSDEVLNLAFMAFCDEDHPAVFPDITYGFYPVFARLNGVPYTEIPLKGDLSVDPADYLGLGKTIFLANPNAPTGKLLPVSDIERIVAANPQSVVVIDEAYIDFGGTSCLPLIRKYDNLLVTRTFSKSRSMAGARLGFGVGCEALIRDLNTLRYSTNPYNVNSATLALGLGVVLDEESTRRNCAEIIRVREKTAAALRTLGFELPASSANFLFARSPQIGGEELYRRLKERRILVRHFSKPEIADFNRITIGTEAQMDALLAAVRAILEETK